MSGAADGDASLLACAWERYQGFGGYVMRAEGSGPPVVERAFTDEGSFVADDEGALGFTGSCRVTPRIFDPEEAARFDPGREPELKPVLCVRKGGGAGGPPAWIQRRVDPRPGETLLAWIPRRDGTAVALLLAEDPLPEVERVTRVREQGGVRVVRVQRELPGWSAGAPELAARDARHAHEPRPPLPRARGRLDRRLASRRRRTPTPPFCSASRSARTAAPRSTICRPT